MCLVCIQASEAVLCKRDVDACNERKEKNNTGTSKETHSSKPQLRRRTRDSTSTFHIQPHFLSIDQRSRSQLSFTRTDCREA